MSEEYHLHRIFFVSITQGHGLPIRLFVAIIRVVGLKDFFRLLLKHRKVSNGVCRWQAFST